jgi:hypothetical protein
LVDFIKDNSVIGYVVFFESSMPHIALCDDESLPPGRTSDDTAASQEDRASFIDTNVVLTTSEERIYFFSILLEMSSNKKVQGSYLPCGPSSVIPRTINSTPT